GEGRYGVDPDREQVIRIALKELEGVRVNFADLCEEVGVADLAKPGLLLVRRKAGQVIHLLRIHALNVMTHLAAKRSLGQEFGPRCRSQTRNQAIFAERLAIEKDTRTQFLVKLLIVSFVEKFGIDTQIGQHPA